MRARKLTRLRILRVIARMNVGGPARQVAVLATGLDPARFEQHLLLGDVNEGEADDLELHARRIVHETIPGLGRAPHPLDDMRALAHLRTEVRRFRPHVIHTHTAKAGFLGRIAGLTAARPPMRPALVHTFHGHLLGGYFSPRTTRLVVTVEGLLATRTDRLIAVGERVGAELRAAGVGRTKRWEVVPPGITLGALPDRPAARAQLGLPPSTPVIAYVGRLTAVKRPDRLVELATLLARDWPSAIFVVAGDGELGAKTRADARAARLGDRMRFLGWQKDVEAIYAAADVTVLTSDNEGMPVSLIEAALAGRPAVTTDVGSAAEVVLDGETGLVVGRHADALAYGVSKLLADDNLRAMMGEAASRHAHRHFSAERLVCDTATLYEDLVTERGWEAPER